MIRRLTLLITPVVFIASLLLLVHVGDLLALWLRWL